ncbi:hypothetical protein [Peribacillus sp. NPDC097895]
MEEARKAAFTAHAAVAAGLPLYICLGMRFMNSPTKVFLISEAS